MEAPIQPRIPDNSLKASKRPVSAASTLAQPKARRKCVNCGQWRLKCSAVSSTPWPVQDQEDDVAIVADISTGVPAIDGLAHTHIRAVVRKHTIRFIET